MNIWVVFFSFRVILLNKIVHISVLWGSVYNVIKWCDEYADITM